MPVNALLLLRPNPSLLSALLPPTPAPTAQPQHAATVARAALLLARCFRLGPGDVRLLSDSARNPGGAGSEDGSDDGEQGGGEGQREGVVQLVLQTHPQVGSGDSQSPCLVFGIHGGVLNTV